MEGLNETSKFLKEVCDLKHKAIEDNIETIKESVDEVTHPTTGHIASLRTELEAKINRVDSKLNGFIMAVLTAVSGLLLAVGTELYQKLFK